MAISPTIAVASTRTNRLSATGTTLGGALALLAVTQGWIAVPDNPEAATVVIVSLTTVANTVIGYLGGILYRWLPARD